MIALGLTGSIAMGKSEAARMLARFGAPVLDSDKVVHDLLGPGGGAVEPVGRAFAGVRRGERIDRPSLGALVFDDPGALHRLEAILHPLVFAERERFLDRARRSGARVAVLDIPLLFETGSERSVDRVAVVSAPAEVQRARARARPGMTEERLQAILARQMPDAEKCRRADYVLPSGAGKRPMLRAIKTMLRELCALAQEQGERGDA